MSFTIIQGKWCHHNGEPLNPIDKNQLSKQINNMKCVAELTHSDNLHTIFHIINSKPKSIRLDLINKIFNQSDSAIAIINSKI